MIGPFCTLETGARIGNGALLSPYVFVGMDASIGERSRLYVRASILPRVSVGEGCVVGPHELVRKDLPAQQALVDGKRFAARKLSSARE